MRKMMWQEMRGQSLRMPRVNLVVRPSSGTKFESEGVENYALEASLPYHPFRGPKDKYW